MSPESDAPTLRLAIPKGRMHSAVVTLLADAGVHLRFGERDYRPTVSLPGYTAKILKPQNILEMLHAGSRDIGFAGADWVAELGCEVVELLDTGLDPVRLVAAAPAELLLDGQLPDRPLVLTSEYERLSRDWIARRGIDARFIRSFGATEVFPPEDADLIIDNTATGSTLRANGLEIVDDVMRSSTRLYAHPAVLEDRERRAAVDSLILLLRSVLDARRRVMIEVNVPRDRLEAVVSILPCMREPTIAPLHGDAGYAVKAAIPREQLATIVPRLKAQGGSDIVVSNLSNIVP
ncbi:MAG: ATP phosphoribosyltransferase [Phycisphaerales bacterium]|nr:ATP phosphoribosyltransferase [Phycisphaerales bacterium]